jgi:tetratricopeptide (TPR) repeat protein
VLLAYTLTNRGHPSRDVLPLVEEAERLSAHVARHERWFIQGTAQEVRGFHAEACATFNALAKLEPTHYWAVNNAAMCSRDLTKDMVAWADGVARRADAAPDSIDDNVIAAWANEFLIVAPSRAAKYRNRAEALRAAGRFNDPPNLYADAWLRLRSPYKKWLANDTDGALGDFDTNVRCDLDRLPTTIKEDVKTFAGDFLLTLGRVRSAEEWFEQVADGGRPGDLAFVAYAR